MKKVKAYMHHGCNLEGVCAYVSLYEKRPFDLTEEIDSDTDYGEPCYLLFPDDTEEYLNYLDQTCFKAPGYMPILEDEIEHRSLSYKGKPRNPFLYPESYSQNWFPIKILPYTE